MQNISAEALDKVLGGTAPANNGSSTSSSSSSGSSSDQLLTAVQGIESSLKDLKNDNNKGLFGGPNGALMFLMMGLALSRRNDTVVINGGGYHGGYWYRSGW